jgi:hypothetical protein
MNPRIVYLVVICITVLSMAAGACGAWLVSKGYQGGELMIGTCGTGLGGLIAMLSSTRTTPAGSTSDPLKTEVTNTDKNPVQTQETK